MGGYKLTCMRINTNVRRMHTTLRPDVAIRVAVRRTEWHRRMNSAGLTTAVAQGEALGVHHSTAHRVARGEVAPSTSIIGRAMILLGARFEELFEVTEEYPAEAVA